MFVFFVLELNNVLNNWSFSLMLSIFSVKFRDIIGISSHITKIELKMRNEKEKKPKQINFFCVRILNTYKFFLVV